MNKKINCGSSSSFFAGSRMRSDVKPDYYKKEEPLPRLIFLFVLVPVAALALATGYKKSV